MEYEINELYPSARHAYIAIGLAVKTSRPHNEIENLRFSWSNYVLTEPCSRQGFFKIMINQSSILVIEICPDRTQWSSGSNAFPEIPIRNWFSHLFFKELNHFEPACGRQMSCFFNMGYLEVGVSTDEVYDLSGSGFQQYTVLASIPNAGSKGNIYPPMEEKVCPPLQFHLF